MLNRRKEQGKYLSENDKYQLLVNNKLPMPKYSKASKTKTFHPSMVTKHKDALGRSIEPLHYSEAEAKLYCLSCIFFPYEDPKYRPKKFINGYSDWKRASGNDEKGIKHHLLSNAHRTSVEKCGHFKARMEGVLSQECFLDYVLYMCRYLLFLVIKPRSKSRL